MLFWKKEEKNEEGRGRERRKPKENPTACTSRGRFMHYLKVLAPLLCAVAAEEPSDKLGDVYRAPRRYLEVDSWSSLSETLGKFGGVIQNNDEVIVKQGTYMATGSVGVRAADVAAIVRCEFYSPMLCVLDGNKEARLLKIDGTGNSEMNLRGLIMRNGFYDKGSAGGCLAVYNSESRVTITFCRFTDNEASSSGGAIYVAAGEVTLYGCYFGNNVPNDIHIEDGSIRINLCGHGFYEAADSDGVFYTEPLQISEDDFGDGQIYGLLRSYNNCGACESGKYTESNSAKRSCLDCAPGYFNDEEGNFMCYKCDYGKYQDAEGSSECHPCSAGKSLGLLGATSEDDCKICEYGAYASEPASKSCALCPRYHVSQAIGSTDDGDCYLCPEDLLASKNRKVCQKSIACPDPEAAFLFDGECVGCDKGFAAYSIVTSILSFVAIFHLALKFCSNKVVLGMVKITVGYVQVSSLVSLVDLRWADGAKAFLPIFWLQRDTIKCLNGTPQDWNLLTDIVVLTSGSIVAGSLLVWKKNSYHRDSFGRLEYEILLVLFSLIVFIPINYTSLISYECFVDLENSRDVHLADPNHKCPDLLVLLLSMLITLTFGIGFPVWLYATLAPMTEFPSTSPLYYFFFNYKDEWAFAEALVLGRKIILVIWICMFKNFPKVQAFGLLAFHIIWIISVAKKDAFKMQVSAVFKNSGLFYAAEIFSSVVTCTTTLIAGIVAASSDHQTPLNPEGNPSIENIGGNLIATINFTGLATLILWTFYENRHQRIEPVQAFHGAQVDAEIVADLSGIHSDAATEQDTINQTPTVHSEDHAIDLHIGEDVGTRRSSRLTQNDYELVAVAARSAEL